MRDSATGNARGSIAGAVSKSTLPTCSLVIHRFKLTGHFGGIAGMAEIWCNAKRRGREDLVPALPELERRTLSGFKAARRFGDRKLEWKTAWFVGHTRPWPMGARLRLPERSADCNVRAEYQNRSVCVRERQERL